MNKLTKDEIKELILERGLTLEEVIDAVIDINGIIGVGLTTLADFTSNYIRSKIRQAGRQKSDTNVSKFRDQIKRRLK